MDVVHILAKMWDAAVEYETLCENDFFWSDIVMSHTNHPLVIANISTPWNQSLLSVPAMATRVPMHVPSVAMWRGHLVYYGNTHLQNFQLLTKPDPFEQRIWLYWIQSHVFWLYRKIMLIFNVICHNTKKSHPLDNLNWVITTKIVIVLLLNLNSKDLYNSYSLACLHSWS